MREVGPLVQHAHVRYVCGMLAGGPMKYRTCWIVGHGAWLRVVESLTTSHAVAYRLYSKVAQRRTAWIEPVV